MRRGERERQGSKELSENKRGMGREGRKREGPRGADGPRGDSPRKPGVLSGWL